MRQGSEPPTPAARPQTDRDAPIPVSRLAGMIERTLKDGLPPRLRIIGEISGFRDRTHWYFDLKDEQAVINCVMFSSAVRRCRFRPEPGQEVVISGRVEFYGKQGRTQIYAEQMEPVGAGALDLAFKQLFEELKRLGWFEPERKKPLPAFPRRVAVVTSRTGAALQDVLDTFKRRCPAIGVLVADVRVQGDGAAGEVASMLHALNRAAPRLGLDAIIVTRGGGSKEDLWAFNERPVAEAILRSVVPVVCAIGHETDTSIAELVADERCATPTQAAMRLSPETDKLLEQLDMLERRMHHACQRRVRLDTERLRAAARHPIFARPRSLLERQSERLDRATDTARRAVRADLSARAARLDRLSARLQQNRPTAQHARRVARLEASDQRLAAAINRRLRAHDLQAIRDRLARAAAQRVALVKNRLAHADRTLNAVGPQAVLRRGFTVTVGADGRAIRSVKSVQPGETIETVVADGRIRSRVDGDGDGGGGGDGGERPVPKAPSTPKTPRKAGEPQLDLFGTSG